MSLNKVSTLTGSDQKEGVSYTEKEYDYALKKGIKVIAFLHRSPENLPAKDSETTKETIEKLNAFRDKVSTGRLVEFWENKDQLAGMVALGITSLKKIHPAIGWVRADKTSSIESLGEINILQKKNKELEEQVKKLNINNERYSKSNVNLANLSSFVTIEIIDNNTKKVSLSKELSWSEILSNLSGLIFDSISEYSVSQLLKDICLDGNEQIFMTYSNILSPQSLNKVKVQFYALGYIDFQWEIDHDNGEQYRAWVSTENGKKAILDLITIKDEEN